MADEITNDTVTSATSTMSTTFTSNSSIPVDLLREDPPGLGPGEDYASPGAITALGGYLLFMLIALLYFLITLWPQPTPSMSHSEVDRVVAQRSHAQPAQSSARQPSSTPLQGDTPAVQDTTKGGGESQPSGTNLQTNPDTNRSGSNAAADSVRNQIGLRHARMVIPGPGVQGVPGFYECVKPPSAALWVVHEDDVLDPQCVKILWKSIPISNEVRVLLVVLLSGALGALLYTLRSLRWYVGTRYLKQSWLLQYYLFPFIGAVLALGTYAVLRGPFFNSASDVSETSPLSFAAAAFLVGLFNEEAIEKLREIAKSVFTPKKEGPETAPGVRPGESAGSGSLAGTQLPAEEGDASEDDDEPIAASGQLGISRILMIAPGEDGGPSTLEIRGSGFTATTQVEVDGAARQPQFQNGTLLTLALTDAEIAKLAAMGTLEVVAVEPGPGGARSEPVHVP